MSELLELVASPLNILWVLLGFGFAPGFCLRLIVLLYPVGHPRRKELVAELYVIKRPLRPLFVAEQLETALFEGIKERRKAGRDKQERARAPKGLRSSIRRARQRRELENANAEAINEIRWLWRKACVDTPLSPMVYTPSGPSRAVPVVDHVSLGPPVKLIVKMRSSQTLADFVAAAPVIASSMGVAEVQVSPIVQNWVRVVLVPVPTGDSDE